MNPNWLNSTRILFADGAAGTGGAAAPSAAPAGGGGAPAAPGGGGPSPSGGDGAPSSPIPDSPAEPAAGHDAFAGMEDSDFDLVEVPVEGEPGEGAPQPQPPAAQPPAGQPAPTTAAKPAVPGQQPPAAPAAPAADAPQPPRSPLEAAIEGFRTNHKAMSDWASGNLFALSKEDAEGLESDAVTIIPILMGRVYSQAIQATTNLIKNFVPQMISEGVATTQARSAKASEALQEFYASHPHLNPQQHGAAVDKWARAFRAANPQASRADAIKFVGNAVSAELGIQPGAAGPNGATRRAAPFAPARPGTRVQQPSAQHDPYEGMDMEYDQE
jgi:hypothetical protein